MSTIKSLLTTSLILLLLSSISSADTFVVTNLNDPGAGSLRQAIINSNLNPGLDEIVFEEGLSGTIFLNLGDMTIGDDLTINGPGGERITIDADLKSHILNINDDNEEKNSTVNIIGVRFINAIAGNGGAIDNSENLTVNSCQFLNGRGGDGAAIYNRKFLTVDSCLFENNTGDVGAAIYNGGFLTVDSCLFENNSANNFGGAIFSDNIAAILGINNSEFIDNRAEIGGAIQNQGNVELISNSTFSDNSASSSGAINNFRGTIKEIRNCTFNNNFAVDVGGAIFNQSFDLEVATIQSIVNSTFYNNASLSGNAIRNDGLVNISFSTIANNPSPTPFPSPPPVQSTDLKGIEMERGGIVTVGLGITRVRNSIISSNSPDNCFGFLDDFGGNYSNDFSCGLFGDGAEIILNPLADNGGPTETMELLGGDPEDGATVNCDALDENGNPTGIPIGVDQRYFPRPYGTRCDSGAFENTPSATVTITKVTNPAGGSDFRFTSSGFDPRQECPLDGGGDGMFALSDGESISCNVPQGSYSINEIIPQGYELLIFCIEAPDNIVINNETGDINFTIEDSSSAVDCIFTNIKKGNGGDSCSLSPVGASSSVPLYLLIPALILIRRFVRKYRFRAFKGQ